ncbi:hypothetical protein MPER_09703, partial [Moniliophthora perniciosa FA553]
TRCGVVFDFNPHAEQLIQAATKLADRELLRPTGPIIQGDVLGAGAHGSVSLTNSDIILSWYFCSHARSAVKCAQLFLTTAHALRLAVPLSLNVCPPFHSIAKTARSTSLLPAAKTVIDDETRRNTFCGWASSLDDQDIFQLLPVRNDQFQRASTMVTYKVKSTALYFTSRAGHFTGEDIHRNTLTFM